MRSGLHFILPIVVLVWALMVDRLSPGLSAFWATAFMIFMLLTQRPLMVMMRGTDRALSNIEAHPEGFNMLRRMCAPRRARSCSRRHPVP